MSVVFHAIPTTIFWHFLIDLNIQNFTLVLPIQGVLEGRDKVPKYLKKSLLWMKEDSSIGKWQKNVALALSVIFAVVKASLVISLFVDIIAYTCQFENKLNYLLLWALVYPSMLLWAPVYPVYPSLLTSPSLPAAMITSLPSLNFPHTYTRWLPLRYELCRYDNDA